MDDSFKHDVAIGVTSELSQNFSQQAEAAQVEVHQAEGAVQACALGSQRIQQLSEHLDAEQDEMSPEQYEAAKRWVSRCYGTLISLQNQVEVKIHTLSGKALGLRQAAEQVEKECRKHESRKIAVQNSDEEDPARARVLGRDRTPGTRPENSLADRKRQEHEAGPDVDEAAEVEPEERVAEDVGVPSDLETLLKRELITLAKSMDIPFYGTKREIIERIEDANTG